jgi:hypothetical protein
MATLEVVTAADKRAELRASGTAIGSSTQRGAA